MTKQSLVVGDQRKVCGGRVCCDQSIKGVPRPGQVQGRAANGRDSNVGRDKLKACRQFVNQYPRREPNPPALEEKGELQLDEGRDRQLLSIHARRYSSRRATASAA